MSHVLVAAILLWEADINGGVTVDAFGEIQKLESGYVVGGKVPTFVTNLRTDDTPGYAVAEWVYEHPSDFYGSWLDQKTGVTHIDAVDVVQDRDEAIRLGLSRGEIAIWDAAAGEEIRLADFVDEHGQEPDPFAGHYDESGY